MQTLRKKNWVRKAAMVLCDALLIALAIYLALMLRFETLYNLEFANTFRHILELISVYLLLMALTGMYDVLWKYAGITEAMRLTLTALAACIITLLGNAVFRWSISRGMLAIACILTVALIGGSRIVARLVCGSRFFRRHVTHNEVAVGPRLMIVGAGAAGAFVLQMCKNDPGLGEPLLFVDDNMEKQRLRVQGVPVRGRTEDIPVLAEKHDIQEIIIAIPSLKGAALAELIDRCKMTNCRVRISTQMQSSDQCQVFVRELNITDFLSRDEIKLDTENIEAYLRDRVVLVTGGGGSIGSELCRQIMRFSPARLIIFDIYENCAYELLCDLRQKYGADSPIEVLIGSVRDRERLNQVFGEYRPDVVFHAAAHKHVPLMEDSPAEAVKNNVFGTLNVLRCADAHGVKRFVLLSTDKAVNPTNVMGATKRMTEMLIQYFAGKTEMRCMAVRFGNVLGSHGSVIPLFEHQIKTGGPVTVTHPDVIRYFMTIPEAAQLVLQAGGIAESGSIFVLDMGEPVRIDDLARQLIRFHGYEPDVNMRIVYTGLRPGEKLYEELLTNEESGRMKRTGHDKIMIAPPIPKDPAQLERELDALRDAAQENNAAVVALLRQAVPTFNHE